MQQFAKFLLVLWKGGAQGLVYVTCFLIAITLAPHVYGRYITESPEVVPVSPVIDPEARERLRAAANLVSELHAGSAPRDAEFVPFWHRVFESLDNLVLAMNRLAEATRDDAEAARALTAKLDEIHQTEMRSLTRYEEEAILYRRPPPVEKPKKPIWARMWDALTGRRS